MDQSSGKITSYTFVCQQASPRLDTFLAKSLPTISRTTLKSSILQGHVFIDATRCIKPNTRIHENQCINLLLHEKKDISNAPQPIRMDCVYEDEHLLVINKPHNLTVHPGAGQPDQTLLNGLLHYLPSLAKLPRAGIVHRLDKDTTGLMMIAKTSSSYSFLTHELAQRRIKRNYIAIVDGTLKSSQTIDKSIGRHKTQRTMMAVQQQGKPAITHITVQSRLQGYTLVSCQLETGRTHQIRVHMQSIGHPLLGDATYGKHRGYQTLPCNLALQVKAFTRQALHAYALYIPAMHKDRKPLSLTCQPPEDMRLLIDALAT